MLEVTLIRKNRFQVGSCVIQKSGDRWCVVKDLPRRRGCFMRPHDVVYTAVSLMGAVSWVNKHLPE